MEIDLLLQSFIKKEGKRGERVYNETWDFDFQMFCAGWNSALDAALAKKTGLGDIFEYHEVVMVDKIKALKK